jgi:hypothetical protein
MPGKPAADRSINLYIDGYNFYIPLSRSGKESDYELARFNFLKLGEHLLDRPAREDDRFARCRLEAVKYFTATIPHDMPSDPSAT